MSNPKRNHPCPCGSGRKYKSCCMKKELEMEAEKTIVTPHSLNQGDGRSPVQIETDKVGEAVMLRRDQYVTMRQLQLQKKMLAKDAAFNKAAIDEYNYFLIELKELPICEAERAVAVMVMKQIEVLTKQVEQSKFGRANVITLAALEAVFAPTSEEIAQEQLDETPSEYVEAFGETAEELKDE